VPSTEILVADLRAAGLTDLARRAETGEFHDFQSDHAFPMMTLMKELEAAARPTNHRQVKQLQQNVRDGKYDATKEESDAWAASPEGQDAFSKLARGE
jgi:hypothetical protein